MSNTAPHALACCDYRRAWATSARLHALCSACTDRRLRPSWGLLGAPRQGGCSQPLRSQSLTQAAGSKPVAGRGEPLHSAQHQGQLALVGLGGRGNGACAAGRGGAEQSSVCARASASGGGSEAFWDVAASLSPALDGLGGARDGQRAAGLPGRVGAGRGGGRPGRRQQHPTPACARAARGCGHPTHLQSSAPPPRSSPPEWP